MSNSAGCSYEISLQRDLTSVIAVKAEQTSQHYGFLID